MILCSGTFSCLAISARWAPFSLPLQQLEEDKIATINRSACISVIMGTFLAVLLLLMKLMWHSSAYTLLHEKKCHLKRIITLNTCIISVMNAMAHKYLMKGRVQWFYKSWDLKHVRVFRKIHKLIVETSYVDGSEFTELTCMMAAAYSSRQVYQCPSFHPQ